jgi:hypothetical protein
MTDKTLDALKRALKPFADAYVPDNHPQACDPAFQEFLDINEVTPRMKLGDFRRAHEALAAANAEPAQCHDCRVSHSGAHEMHCPEVAANAAEAKPELEVDMELTVWLHEFVRMYQGTLRNYFCDGRPVGKWIVERVMAKAEVPAIVAAIPDPMEAPVRYGMRGHVTGYSPMDAQPNAAQVEKNAARYQYMRNSAAFQDRNGPGLYWYLPRYMTGSAAERLDVVIDAAIEAQPKNTDLGKAKE